MTSWTAACQASLSITNSQSRLKPMSIESVMPSNDLILCFPFSSCLPSFSASGCFPESVLRIRWPNIGTSALASVLPMNIQDSFPLGLTGLISLLSNGFSSPTPQFKTTTYLALSFLYGPTLIPIHDYWKNYSFD